MRLSTLLARNLAWYWRTNLAVLLGVATATGVLGGALLVGDSVRASLRDLVLGRLGDAQYLLTRDGFFREELADTPLIWLEGFITHEPSGRRASRVEVYGIGAGGQVLLTAALARELGSQAGDTVLLRVQKPSAIPLESLHGRKEDTGKSMRLEMGGVAPREFSLRPQQGDVRAVYLPLARLQREFGQPGRINASVSASMPDVRNRYTLADLGLTLRTIDEPSCLSLESDSALISDALAEVASQTAKSMGLRAEPVLTYLANTIRAGKREIPYSVVTALDSAPAPAGEKEITLNAWTARDLAAKPGDAVSLEYYVWKSDARLATETARFRVSRIVPIEGAAADRELSPRYPGITGSESLHDWDPPFPLDLARIRPADEHYWKQYRTTPKAFVRLKRGRELWGTRYGSLTSIRIVPPSAEYAAALRAAIDPAKMGLSIIPVKAEALEAAQGATDFGEYFTYFSFFLMLSALLLTALFFRFGVEQRMREIGALRALGFSRSRIRGVFLLEGVALSVAGAVIGVGVALAYGALILFGLRTWWLDAVGTRLLSLHASVPSLLLGAAAGVATGLASIAWTLRRLEPVTPRGLLAGEQRRTPLRRRVILGAIAVLGAFALGTLGGTAGFFGAGALLLIAALAFESAWLASRSVAAIAGQVTLGFRSATYRPGRSILCVALIASATFLIVALDAFRRDGSTAGAGGYPLMAESVLPIVNKPDAMVPFRLRPGDDASCLNLYRPRNPRILAPPPSFLRSARFEFQSSITRTENPWLLLEATQHGGAVPAIADANSMTYVLHKKLGEEFEIDGTRFRIVAALRDSIFQGELLISEQNFLRLYPEIQGYRLFLLNDAGALEDELSDYGFDIQRTDARLASFHKVENTYLATFRALGALGLILGTLGLGAVVLRNVLERRKELALLRAVGYRPRHLALMVLAENALLLLLGLATGAGCALLAVAPAVSQRGGQLPVLSLGVLLAAVLLAGLAASVAATAVALRSPLLAALKSE